MSATQGTEARAKSVVFMSAVPSNLLDQAVHQSETQAYTGRQVSQYGGVDAHW
jgi:hypothetical protein